MEVAAHTQIQAPSAALGSLAAACHSHGLGLVVAQVVAVGGMEAAQRPGQMVVVEVVLLASLGVGCSCRMLVVQVELGRAVAHSHVEEVAADLLLVLVPRMIE